MDLYDGLLSELECKICMTFMGPPIRQCKTGHSICEPCMKKLTSCPLCRGEFTIARNIALESLARKMMYPCVNARFGCCERFLFDDREKHESTCTYKGYKCALPRCSWRGPYSIIKTHWLDKKQRTSPYKEMSVCHTKLDRSDKYYVNLCIAHDQLFWFKFKNDGGKLYWNVQFIGDENEAKNYYFEIELIKPGDNFRKYIMSDYCSSENDPETQTNVTTTIGSINGYLDKEQLLVYYLRIKKVPTKAIENLTKSVDDLLIHFDENDSDSKDSQKGPTKKNFRQFHQRRGRSQHRNKPNRAN